ncbi:MAG TPA: glycerophosphodiester phosphodiesterase family protein, partial [Clostridia bacterium]|nr:glycerophosphodiester phosphodiesterase family protein [Clostridia bacterium]
MDRPLVIAHRGFSEFAPENTLPAFALALIAGADLVELDYHHSLDGEPVVIHDRDLDRTTDAAKRWGGKQIRIGTKTASEIQSLDAGAWFDARYAGSRVPLLKEALTLIQKGAVPLIERKTGSAHTCIRLLRNLGLINRVVVQSFDWAYLQEFHEQEPEQVLAALGPPVTLPDGRRVPRVFQRLNARWLSALQRTGAKVAVWNKQVSIAAIELAHEQGVKVWVYTINQPETAQRLLELGVDGLITNNPALIWKT